jgi:hypothetical protein
MHLFILTISFIFGGIASLITWKVAPFFLARRQYYVKSQYELLKIKISWCISWFIIVFMITFSLLGGDIS